MSTSPVGTTHRVGPIEVALGVLLVACCLLFVRHYVAIEHPAYIWDWGGYYDIYRRYSRLLAENATAFRHSVLASISSDNYNPSAVVAIMPVALIFGEGRSPFVAAIIVLYLVPACLIMGFIARLALRETGKPVSYLGSCLLLFACIAYFPIWPSALRGMPDSISLIPLGLSTILLLRTRFLTRATVVQAALLGLMIWSAFLFRRWYAFSCVGLLSASAFFCALTIFTDFRRQRTQRSSDEAEPSGRSVDRPAATGPTLPDSGTVFGALVRAGLLYALTGLVVVAGLAIFQRPLALEILRTSYADLYAGYQSDFAGQMAVIRYRFGEAMIFLALAGVAVAVWTRNTTVLFCTLSALIAHCLFMRTQAPSVQHTLPLFFWLFPAVAFALMQMFACLPKFARLLYTSLVAVFFTIGFLGSFLPSARAQLAPFAAVYPAVPTLPLHLENFDEYRRMADDVQALVPPDARIGVLASSEVLTPNLLRILTPTLESRIEPTSNVDLVDGLQLAPLRADYAIATTPVTLHMAPPFQRVVSIPAEAITGGLGFGSAYSQIAGPYQLGSVQAILYKRDRPLSAADITELEQALKAYYPEWRWNGDDLIYRSANP